MLNSSIVIRIVLYIVTIVAYPMCYWVFAFICWLLFYPIQETEYAVVGSSIVVFAGGILLSKSLLSDTFMKAFIINVVILVICLFLYRFEFGIWDIYKY
ncbi:hypothetical protein D0T85_00330 [Bacteroides sp. 519]|nr:hypothetical protein [Bacteroides sp. 519]